MQSDVHSGEDSRPFSVSVVIPLHNEAENVEELHEQLTSVLKTLPVAWEVCYVDDGSTDDTPEKLRRIAGTGDNIQVVYLTRQFGQSAALRAGMEATHGDVVVTLDGDLQNDPRDIPRFLEKISEGYDVVHGWRAHRQDSFFTRRLPSQVANWVIRQIVGAPTPDLGCGIRAMRRWVADHLDLMGDMHRYLPILAQYLGATSTVIVVNHRPRKAGKSKYGVLRLFAVLADIPLLLLLTRFRWKPSRFMGILSILFVSVGLFTGLPGLAWTLLGRLTWGIPFLAATVMSWSVGAFLFAFGLLAELQPRLVHAGTRNAPYVVRTILSGSAGPHVLRFPQPMASEVSADRTGSYG